MHSSVRKANLKEEISRQLVSYLALNSKFLKNCQFTARASLSRNFSHSTRRLSISQVKISQGDLKESF